MWWTLYSLDSEVFVCAGRPPLICLSDVSCEFPTDDTEQDLISTVQLPFSEDEISWLSFHVQSVKLTCAARSVYTVLQVKCNEATNTSNVKDIFADHSITESLATFFRSKMKEVHEWAQNVPAPFKNLCKGAATPFSAGQATLEVDPYSPLWLQRQQILLELLYRYFCMCLYRPFVRFPPLMSSMTPLSDSQGVTCLNHAVATTSLINQVLSETDILSGWEQLFAFQWTANLILLGFIIANPVCPVSPSARRSLDTAMKTLQILSKTFTTATSAITIVRKLRGVADMLADRYRQSLTKLQSPRQSLPPQQTPPTASTSTDPLQTITSASSSLQTTHAVQNNGSHSSNPGSSHNIVDMMPQLQPASSPITTTGLQPDHTSIVTSADLLAYTDLGWINGNDRSFDTWPHFTMDP